MRTHGKPLAALRADGGKYMRSQALLMTVHRGALTFDITCCWMQQISASQMRDDLAALSEQRVSISLDELLDLCMTR